MNKNKTHTEKTAAEKKVIGFDYQYYFFLWKLLSLRTGESVGIEVKDDVHTDLDNDRQILYQLKHTLGKKKDGTSSNLTEGDKDLWKTMSNWAQVISDKNDNRVLKPNQLLFISKTDFVLVSNKSKPNDNDFLNNISFLQDGSKKISDIKNYINKKIINTTDADIKAYMKNVLLLDDDVLEKFLCSTFFNLEEDDLIQKCKDAIKADKIPENRIDDVFAKIDSAIKSDNYIKIKRGQKAVITFDEFYTKYRKHYDLARNPNLFIKRYTDSLSDSLEEQTFIKQLVEIKDIEHSDTETITEFTRLRLTFKTNLEEWIQKGELTNEEADRFKRNAITLWNNKFRSTHTGRLFNLFNNKNGLTIINYLREKELNISNQNLGIELSNGTFYDLSDTPEIGWRSDWDKYKK